MWSHVSKPASCSPSPLTYTFWILVVHPIRSFVTPFKRRKREPMAARLTQAGPAGAHSPRSGSPRLGFCLQWALARGLSPVWQPTHSRAGVLHCAARGWCFSKRQFREPNPLSKVRCKRQWIKGNRIISILISYVLIVGNSEIFSLLSNSPG